MSRVGIELDKGSIQLAPGETAEVRVRVTNLGKVVDAYSLSIVGIDPSWYALTQAEVRLFPEDSDEVILRVQPTSSYSSQAGVYPFIVVVTSHDGPADRAQGQVILILASVGEIAIGVVPQRVRARKGSFWITLQNPSNLPRQVVLVLTDPEEQLRYTLGPTMQVEAAGGKPPSFAPPPSIKTPIAHGEGALEHELHLPPGSDLTLPVVLRPMKRIWTGMERTFNIGVRVHPPGVEWVASEEKRAEMSLVYRPILAAWSGFPRMLRLALTLAVPLLILALLLFLLLKPADGPSGPQLAASQTATAAALSAAQTGTALAASAAQTAQALSQTMTSVAVANGGNQAAANATLTALAMSPEELSAAQTATALAIIAQADAGSPLIDKFYLVVASPTSEGTPPAEGTPPVEGTPTLVASNPNDDGQANVTWDVTSAKALRIDQHSRSFDSPDPDLSLVDYTMVATGTQHVTTNTISILLVRPPQIDSFTADPTVIPEGGSTTLTFQIHGTGTCSIDGVSMPIPPDGKGSVVVTPPGTHIYVHCAENAAGRNCKAVKVTVLPADTPTPAQPTLTLPPVVAPTATHAPAPTTATPRPTSTRAPTPTRKPTVAKPSATPVRPSPTRVPTATATRTSTRPPSATPPPTSTSTPSATSTNTPTYTATATRTSSPTATATRTHTPTHTRTPTSTRTSTATSTRTSTRTPTRTATPTCAPSYVITQDTAPALGIATRTDTGNHCDDCTTGIRLPFIIHLYGQDFTSALVGSNGTISFTNSNALPDNECLPTSRLEFVIFPYWDDLDTRRTEGYSRAGIYTEFIYNSDGSTFSIEWDAMNKASQKPVEFVLHFYELSSRFDVVYLQNDGTGGASATIGVEEAFDPSSGVGNYTEFSCNQRIVGVRTRLRFAYVACQSPTIIIPAGGPGGGRSP